MDDPSPSLGRIARLRAIAEQVRDFANDEAAASRLPGQDQGPADAYRHLVGVAELSRRAGPLLAAAMAERNEWASTEAMLRSILGGRPIAPSNMPAARRMDRHNNLLAVGIGARARSTEDVVMRVRSMMERAIETTGGSGRGNSPYWREAAAHLQPHDVAVHDPLPSLTDRSVREHRPARASRQGSWCNRHRRSAAAPCPCPACTSDASS